MFGYFASKIESEQILAASGLPWTIPRATQFHEGFVLVTVRAMAKLPVIPVPAGIRFQPIDAEEVAARFVELALGPPAGLVPDMAGPKVYELAELLRLYLRLSASTGCSSPSGFQARQRELFGLAPTWHPSGLSASVPLRTSWPSG